MDFAYFFNLLNLSDKEIFELQYLRIKYAQELPIKMLEMRIKEEKLNIELYKAKAQRLRAKRELDKLENELKNE